MDAATILVIALTAGGIALLVWFEINSRRNDAKKKQMLDNARLELDPSQKRGPGNVGPSVPRTSLKMPLLGNSRQGETARTASGSLPVGVTVFTGQRD